MQKRKMKNADMELSLVGLGGCTLMNRPQEEVNREVAFAIEQGINYFDVSPTYGNAEELLGPAMEPFRKDIHLACKTHDRTAAGARKELEHSLRVLRSEQFEIYQLHGLTHMEETRQALGSGGALETLVQAKKQGLTRLIGFSAHDEESALACIETGAFDTMLIPLNYWSFEEGHFGPRAFQAASDRGMDILALKAMARCNVPSGQPRPYSGCWYQPEDRPEVAELLMRWTLGLPGLVAAIPPGNPELWRWGVKFAQHYTPISEAEIASLHSAMRDVAPLFVSR